jgi:hypothetical protein
VITANEMYPPLTSLSTAPCLKEGPDPYTHNFTTSGGHDSLIGTSQHNIAGFLALHYMLSRGQDNWLDPATPEQIAPYFHHYLTFPPFLLLYQGFRCFCDKWVYQIAYQLGGLQWMV